MHLGARPQIEIFYPVTLPNARLPTAARRVANSRLAGATPVAGGLKIGLVSDFRLASN